MFSHALGIKKISKTYIFTGRIYLNTNDNVFSELTLSRLLVQDHSCRSFNRREILVSKSTVRFSLNFCSGKYKTWEKSIAVQNVSHRLQGILTTDCSASLGTENFSLRCICRQAQCFLTKVLLRVFHMTGLGYRAAP